MTNEEEVSRGKEAESILANRFVAAAHQEIEASIIEAIAACPVKDKAERDELIAALQANRRHKYLFTHHVETGKMARITLSKLDRIAQKVNARFR